MVHQDHLQLLQPRRKRRSNSRTLRPRRRNKKRQLKEKQFVRVLDAWTALVVETQEP